MRTDDEILAKARQIQPRDFFGTKTSDLISCLPADQAREFLIPGADLSDWTVFPRDTASICARIREYLPFAWEKANDCRGLSAARSLNHFWAWFWLMGHDLPLDDYTHYGKPQLRAISEFVGFDWQAHDNGRWSNVEDGEGPVLTAADLGLASRVEAAP